MSTFECPVVRVTVEPHPNADAIEIARVGGYMSIIKKGQFKDGDLAVYLPEQSVLPEWLLRRLCFWDDINGKGTLSGSRGNRVRAMRLRGVFSQGILLDGNCGDDTNPSAILVEASMGGIMLVSRSFEKGQSAADWLGITKYEPTIPAHMAGRVAGGDLDATIGYDFENIKKHPTLFDDGEEVVITEKIHGTCLQVGVIPRRIWEGKKWADKCPDIGTAGFKGIVTSKGQGAKGLMLDPQDTDNLYVKMCLEKGLWDRLERTRLALGHPEDMPLFLFGEVFGRGIQDLGYGVGHSFAAFDMYAGVRGNGFFLDQRLFDFCVGEMEISTVPVLYRGPYSAAALASYTDGNTEVSGEKQIREGVVVKATSSSDHPEYGRKIAKSVSEKYLMRKNATEFN